MNAQQYRAMAERCRDLLRIASNDEVRAQLREWEQDFEAEPKAVEKAADSLRNSIDGFLRKVAV